jgi:hypothetical protein
MLLLAFGNIAYFTRRPHNRFMDLGDLFRGFFQTIALGSAAVFILLGVVRLRSPRRTPALIPGKSSRY